MGDKVEVHRGDVISLLPVWSVLKVAANSCKTVDAAWSKIQSTVIKCLHRTMDSHSVVNKYVWIGSSIA